MEISLVTKTMVKILKIRMSILSEEYTVSLIVNKIYATTILLENYEDNELFEQYS